MVGFLVGHLSGNLLIFLGPDDINAYGVELRELLHGSALWVLRIGVLVFFVLHIWSGIKLAAWNRAAKGGANERDAHKASSVASRSMIYTGLLIMVYVLYHLAHFTWGTVHSEYYHWTDAAGRHDVYRMVVASFQQPLITVLYLVAMVVTGMHLSHAISSAFQTLGLNHPRYTPLINLAGPAVGLILVLGFSTVPVAIVLGMVK
jgi:succinate dehydrogenase / fumarate reductase cytochrome b subunit